MRIVLTLLLLTAAPALADSYDMAPDQPAKPTGRDLMGEALNLFMRGLLSEMEPALTEMENLLGQIDAYHLPEALPNGDIIIRRKVPLKPEVDEGGEVEL